MFSKIETPNSRGHRALIALPGKRNGNLRGSDEAAGCPGEPNANTRDGEHLAPDLRYGLESGARTPSTESVVGLAGLLRRGRRCALKLASESSPIRGENRDPTVRLGDDVNHGDVHAALACRSSSVVDFPFMKGSHA